MKLFNKTVSLFFVLIIGLSALAINGFAACTGTVGFTFSPSSPVCANTPITFTNTTTAGSFDTLIWRWGDGTPDLI